MNNNTGDQLTMQFPDRVIELPEYLSCDVHGDYPWACYYEDSEIIEMLDEQGWIDCPTCLFEIVGIE